MLQGSMTRALPVVAVVGATGAVGQEILRVMERRGFKVRELRLLASARSAGKTLRFHGESLPIRELTADAFRGVDLALMSAGASRSREFAPIAVQAGAVVIDNSSAFRMDPEVPLVVPEVNPGDLHHHKGIIANPNCCAAIMAVPLWPLHVEAHIERIVVSTYQSASGAGAQAMAELEAQQQEIAEGRTPVTSVFPFQIANNLFSHNSPIEENGHNGEENKVVAEMRKMFHEPRLPISVTCVRVPVPRAHSESILIETRRALSAERAREILKASPGVQVVDDRAGNHFPMPIEASGKLEVLVGRVRNDLSHPRGLALFVCGDQLLKGAAWNAVQIAETLLTDDWVCDPTKAELVQPF
jgi:aspartate-semialdehyde dehydrogenase